MLKFISKLQWLFWVGFLGVFFDNQYLTLFFLFGLCGFANVFSPMRNNIQNLMFLGQNLWMLVGILIAHFRHGFKLPDKNSYKPQVQYSLPFDGEWYIANGGVDKETSHSWFLPSQRYAYDFFIMNNEETTFSGEREQLENYFCFAENVLAPADGVVISAVSHFPNTPIIAEGQVDCTASDVRGNHIIIRHSKHEYSMIAHLLPESICVKKGDSVSRGQVIAKCGNSGNTSEPHIHFQIQYGKSFAISAGLPVLFAHIIVDGKKTPQGFITNGHYVKNDDLISPYI